MNLEGVQLFNRFLTGFGGEPVFLLQHAAVIIDAFLTDAGDIRFHLRCIVFFQEGAVHRGSQHAADHIVRDLFIRLHAGAAVDRVAEIDGQLIAVPVQDVHVVQRGADDQVVFQVVQAFLRVKPVQFLKIRRLRDQAALRRAVAPGVYDICQGEVGAERAGLVGAHLIVDALDIVGRHAFGRGHDRPGEFGLQRQGAPEHLRGFFFGIAEHRQHLLCSVRISRFAALAKLGAFGVLGGIPQQQLHRAEPQQIGLRIPEARACAEGKKRPGSGVLLAEQR